MINAYECYLSWLAQVKMAHKRIRNCVVGENIYQYQGFREGRDRAIKFIGDNVQEKVEKIMTLLPLLLQIRMNVSWILNYGKSCKGIKGVFFPLIS